MGTYSDLWGPMGPIKVLGDLLQPMGSCSDLWGPLPTYGDLRRPMANILGPLGSYFYLWGPMATFWGPIGAYGVSFLTAFFLVANHYRPLCPGQSPIIG